MYSSDGSSGGNKLFGSGRTYVAGWLVACRGGILVTPPSSKLEPRLIAPSKEMLLDQSWNQTTTVTSVQGLISMLPANDGVLVPVSSATPAMTVLDGRAFCSVVLARCRALQGYDAMLGLGLPGRWRVAYCLDFFVFGPRDFSGGIAGSLIVVDSYFDCAEALPFHRQNMETPLNSVASGIDLSTASTIEFKLNVSEIELARVKRKQVGATMRLKILSVPLDAKIGECQIPNYFFTDLFF